MHRTILNIVSLYPEVGVREMAVAVAASVVAGHAEIELDKLKEQRAAIAWDLQQQVKRFDESEGRELPENPAAQAAWVRDYAGRGRTETAAAIFAAMGGQSSALHAQKKAFDAAALVELGRDAAGLSECVGCTVSTLEFEGAFRRAKERVALRLCRREQERQNENAAKRPNFYSEHSKPREPRQEMAVAAIAVACAYPQLNELLLRLMIICLYEQKTDAQVLGKLVGHLQTLAEKSGQDSDKQCGRFVPKNEPERKQWAQYRRSNAVAHATKCMGELMQEPPKAHGDAAYAATWLLFEAAAMVELERDATGLADCVACTIGELRQTEAFAVAWARAAARLQQFGVEAPSRGES